MPQILKYNPIRINHLTLTRKSQTKLAKKSPRHQFTGLTENMIIGVNTGFEKNLELVGTGYRVAKTNW